MGGHKIEGIDESIQASAAQGLDGVRYSSSSWLERVKGNVSEKAYEVKEKVAERVLPHDVKKVVQNDSGNLEIWKGRYNPRTNSATLKKVEEVADTLGGRAHALKDIPLENIPPMVNSIGVKEIEKYPGLEKLLRG